MEEETQQITVTKIGWIQRKQDYKTELFNLSKSPDREAYSPQEGVGHTMVGRDWCGDLASYVTELENYVRDTYKDIVELRSKE
jgi:hypothetical protein